jgi:hypothetical protein
MKANDNYQLPDRIVLPLPPESPESRTEMEIYARFMRHLRTVPNSREEIQILTSMQFVADMVDISDAEVARVLTECGLRAPRMAFPAEYLNFVDGEGVRGGACKGVSADLRLHWARIGEDRFAGFHTLYPSLTENLFVDA